MDNNQKFQKVLSRVDVLFLAFGAMIGWGWVVLSGTWIGMAGSFGAMIAFVLGGILVTFVGLTYAELASAIRNVGGEVVYVRRGVGVNASFIVGWAIALGYISVVAFEAVALPTVVEYLFPNYKVGLMYTITDYDVYLSWVLVGVIGSILVAFVNYIGVKFAAFIQSILTVLIALIGLMLIFGASINGNFANAEPFFVEGLTGIMTVFVMTPFMFVGFDVIPQASEEMNLQPRHIGRILILSVLFAVIWYVAIIFSVSFALDKNAMANSILPTADAMGAAFGSSVFGKILVLGGIAGIMTSWNAFIIGGSRVLFAMAQVKMLPSWFAKIHPKYNTPSNAILFIGILSIVSPLLGRPMLVWLSNAGGLTIVIAYLFVAIAFIRLRKLEPDLERPFRAGKSTIIGWLAVLMSIFLIALYFPGLPATLTWPYEWLIFFGWWILGFYFMVKRQKQYVSYELKYIDGKTDDTTTTFP